MKALKLFSIAMMGMAITLASCSGEDGKDGLPGEDGTNGINGADGEDGADGADGEDKPNVDFYFQDGFKEYDGTSDVSISLADGGDNTELSTLKARQLATDREYHLMRFDGIAKAITEKMPCGEFNVNRAILYVYVEQVNTDFESPLYFNFGFYNSEVDLIFNQSAANWYTPNGVYEWPGGEGGVSADWIEPIPGEGDNYRIGYPFIRDNAIRPGWYGFQMPRSVVETWACGSVSVEDEDDANEGFRIRFSSEEPSNEASIQWHSSDSPNKDLRPVLVIETEKIDPASANKGTVGSSKKTNWEDMTYEEKMEPLHRFLSQK